MAEALNTTRRHALQRLAAVGAALSMGYAAPAFTQQNAAPDSDIERLVALIDAHRRAFNKFSDTCMESDVVALGAEPSEVALRKRSRCSRAEDNAFLAICQHPATTLGAQDMKARYLLEYTAHSQMSEDQVSALLTSMLWRN